MGVWERRPLYPSCASACKHIRADHSRLCGLDDPPGRDWIKEVRFAQVHFELKPMSGLPMIERALAAADERVGTALEIKIGLRSHRLDDVYDRRKASG